MSKRKFTHYAWIRRVVADSKKRHWLKTKGDEINKRNIPGEQWFVDVLAKYNLFRKPVNHRRVPNRIDQYHRNYPFGKRIIDVFFPFLLLAVEVDGEYHNKEEQIKDDKRKDMALSRFGITVLRIKDFDEDAAKSVINEILNRCEKFKKNGKMKRLVRELTKRDVIKMTIDSDYIDMSRSKLRKKSPHS